MVTSTERLAPHLDAGSRQRLDDLMRDLEEKPEKIATLFPAVGRLVARGPGDPEDPEGVRVPRLEDEARIALLAAVAAAWRDRPDRLARELAQLYRFGDADEKRAVLRALPAVAAGAELVPLVDDALRTNDVRLVAAALGDYGARHLGPEAWRQGVLKCLFVGVDLEAVAELDQRADAELARMIADYCRERAAAGRAVPSDAWRVLNRFPDQARELQPSNAREA